MKPSFCHLRVHSEYSVVDGIVRLDELISTAAGDEQPALALTDLSNMFGLVKFYKAARSKGIKPIIGCDVFISGTSDSGETSRLLLLAKNTAGYLTLCELISRSWLENQKAGKAVIRREWLEDLTRQGRASNLIALSGACFGDVGQALLNDDEEAAGRLVAYWRKVFASEFYLEVQRAGPSESARICGPTIELGLRFGVPIVATHPIQFMRAEEFAAHEARVCIAQGEKIINPRRERLFQADQNFATQEEMTQLFFDVPDALSNSLAIAMKCNVTLDLGKPQLPKFPVPDGMSVEDFLRSESRSGLEKRLTQLYPDELLRAERRPVYEERLTYELDTICNMKFPGYFLIVAEFIKWAKENGIPVGPGRGSGAGSLVAYALLITDLDPIAYNLLFERFLNPERVSMPDFDIDFCQIGRDRVIQHVKDLYGKDAVSQIATFGTMAAKGAIRDVGRVMDMSHGMCDGIAKLIPNKPGKTVTIADSIAEEAALAERYDNEFEVRQLLDMAQQVEGITRNVGMHAGGVLIAPGRLVDFCPLYTQAGDEGVISQYDKDDVEAVGLVKFDFLGLTTLSILDLTVRYVRQLEPSGSSLALEKLALDDPHTYELLADARTVAVFQLESKGMQSMLKDARPDRFEDIIALVALYRPGPMDLIPDFCRRKHGESFSYPDPRTEDILRETYGIMVYQEQVMQMAQVVGGYSLGGADLLRRAMGKKKVDEMAEHRQLFRDGAGARGLSAEKADEIFDLMEKFAGYGFNKSHAAAYALLSYQTAYLKKHHPAAFMAANLSLAIGDTDKIKVLYDDSIQVCGLSFLPPCINESDYYFRPVSDDDGSLTSIRYGLGAVKGVGEGAVAAITEARQDRPFVDLFEFSRRVGKQAVNRRTLEALIKAGAFDGWGVSRATLMGNVQAAIDGAQGGKGANRQVGLFDDGEDHASAAEYIETPQWSMQQQLAEERLVIGFYLSGHPYEPFAEELQKFVPLRLAEVSPRREHVVTAGVISSVRVQSTRRGKMCTATLDDGITTLDVTIFSELYSANTEWLRVDELLVVKGKAGTDNYSGMTRVTAESIWNLAAARHHFGRGITISIGDHVDIHQLHERLDELRTPEGLSLAIRRYYKHVCYTLALDPKWKVSPDRDLATAVDELCGKNALSIDYGT